MHINAYSPNKNFDDLQHLFNCAKNSFDIIGVSETKLLSKYLYQIYLNLKNYSSEFTPTETNTSGILLYMLLIYHINTYFETNWDSIKNTWKGIKFKSFLETRASSASTVLSNDNDNTTTNPILLTSLTITLLL